ncbi:hypothetical protein AX17_007494 [Amanita inopinata Kibby_2008]|nr:hypothetical protein AX17_007494 [Amanita inopinata Kibby_2008]
MTLSNGNTTTDGTLRDGLYIKKVPSPYSPSQLTQYLIRIGFTPEEHVNEQLIRDGKFPATLENLERIIRLHLLAFPFENTAMHYTPNHLVNVDPLNLFDRFVNEGKGSYCLGQNTVFLAVLRGLGYRAYHVASRVNDANIPNPTGYGSQTHLLILVQLQDSNRTYLADVGFGMGPSRPVLLSESEDNIVSGTTATENFRLIRRADPRSSLETDGPHAPINGRNWVLEVKHIKSDTQDSSTLPWVPCYSFSEAEFFALDIFDGSFVVCHQPIAMGLFYNNVIAIKYFLIDEEGKLVFNSGATQDRVEWIKEKKKQVERSDLGRANLMGTVLKYTAGQKSEVKTLKTEAERIEVLRDIFGIAIKDEEVQYMKGRGAALDI